MFTHHRRPLLLLVGLAVGATLMARPDSACADGIFVPGATRVSATFGGVVSEVRGEIPAIPLGTFVSASSSTIWMLSIPLRGRPR